MSDDKPKDEPPAPRMRLGDVVYLKGGSPALTVIGAGPDEDGHEAVKLAWFNDCNDINIAQLDVRCVAEDESLLKE
jgi:uncharacterized protein YodC (DUF2158 family)